MSRIAHSDHAASAASPTNAGSARSMLLTLLGEFVFPDRGPVATTTLLQAFARAGVAESSARQAMSRSAASGWIDGVREGRRTSWRLTDKGYDVIARGSRRLRAVREARADWDGRWLVLYVSIPEAQRARRLRLYRALSWAGFGNPAPSLWICPHADREDDLRQILPDLELGGQALAFVSRHLDVGVGEAELVRRAWDLEAIGRHYHDLQARFTGVRGSPTDPLGEHILLVNALQRLPAIDPGLPQALLPGNWRGHPAIAQLERHRARLAPKAHAQWNEIAAIRS